VLNDVIGDLLRSAFAVALSPIPIIAVVVVLAAPRARSAGSAFALGWIGGLMAVSVIVAAVLFYLVDAQRAARPLEAIRRFRSDNNAVIMMIVLLLLGAKLLGDGLTVL
jgi:hypothetical protein